MLTFMAATNVLRHWENTSLDVPPGHTYIATTQHNIIKAIGGFEDKGNGQLRFHSLWFSPTADAEEKKEILDLILTDSRVEAEMPALKRQNAQVYLEYVYNLDDFEDDDYDGCGA